MNIGIFVAGDAAPQGEKRNYDFLVKRGVSVIEHPICKKQYNGHLAGTAIERANALHELYLDDRIDVVMSFWGGLNTNEILHSLDYSLIKENYKPTIGFSDTTALLNAITKMTGHITYLGPSGITFLKPEPLEYSFESMLKMLSGEKEIFIIDSKIYADDAYYLRKSPNNLAREIKTTSGRSVIRQGIATGTVVAGNMQTLAALSGTQYFPNLYGAILFLEEDEFITAPVFRRFITQLSQQDNFRSIRGVVFGRMPGVAKITEEQFANCINDVFGKTEIPILANLDFGHTDPMFTIPIGGIAHINTETKTLIFNQ